MLKLSLNLSRNLASRLLVWGAELARISGRVPLISVGCIGKNLLFNYWPIPLVLDEHTFGVQ